MATLTPLERARLLALMMQNDQETARLTVADLVQFGRWTWPRGRPSAGDRHVVTRALAQFELEALADRQIDTLSRRQRQRAFVAIVWAQQSSWLVLDNPLPRSTRAMFVT
ncbi:ATP-binding cassette domain-containing protein [Vannielia sp. SX4]|uniref:ATP-binding cassette domain-containing protein n=1 Tax=Vannielia sp. SX4 TaxID=3463852 RepID=UPI0040598384